MMPVPRVSVRNCERNPISPRAGMRNSRRTRPLPWFTILVIWPLRMPTSAMTVPWNSSATSMTSSSTGSIIVPFFSRLRVSPVLGFLGLGAVLGPYGLGLFAAEIGILRYAVIDDLAGVRPFAELGVVFLLFMIGLELSPDRLWALRRLVFPSRRDWPIVLTVGVLQLSCYFALANVGVAHLPASRSAVLGYGILATLLITASREAAAMFLEGAGIRLSELPGNVERKPVIIFGAGRKSLH